jgi:hypothetical protein
MPTPSTPYDDKASWVVLVDPTTGLPYTAAGGGGGVAAAVTSIDGGIVSLGAVADAAVGNPASSGSVIAFLKGLITILTGGTQTTKTLGPNGLFNATVKGYQQITSLAAATALTVPSGSKYCIIQCETQAVRWRDDGTNPTAAIGMRLLTTGELYYDGDLAAIKFIEETASAKLNISYYA